MGVDSANVFFNQLSEFRYGKEQTGEDAWYFKLSKEVGKSVSEQKKQLESPDLSKINSLSDLFGLVRDASNPLWEEAMRVSLDKSFIGYVPKSTEGRDILQSLKDNTSLDALLKDMKSGENSELEALRGLGDTEIWISLLLAMSEREKLKSSVLHKWIDKIPSDQEIECFSKWGMSKQELLLFADLNLELQPNIDRAYAQQLLISDSNQITNRNPSKYDSVQPSSYLYIYGEEKAGARSTFKELFPQEITNIEKTLCKYAKQIQIGVQRKDLTKSYRDMPSYLTKLANMLSSDEKSFSKIKQLIDDCSISCAKLMDDGCHVLIKQPGYVSAGGKRVDIEMMIGASLGNRAELFHEGEQLSVIAKNYAKSKGLTEKVVPSLIHAIIFAKNGSSIPWTCGAVVTEHYLLLAETDSKEEDMEDYLELSNLIKDEITPAEYAKAVSLGSLLHDLGHVFFSHEVKEIFKRLGGDLSGNKLEELKADCAGMILFKEYLKNGGTSVTSKAFISQYLLEYTTSMNDSKDSTVDVASSWYAFSGKTIIAKLLESKSVEWTEGQFVILDADKGVDVIAELGETIINKYQDPKFGHLQAAKFVKEMEDTARHELGLNLFLSKLDLIERRKKIAS